MNLYEYVNLTAEYDVIPVSETFILDTVTPIGAVASFAKKEEEFFLLESAAGEEHLGRYSFLGLKPFAVFTSQNGVNKIQGIRNEENTLSPYEALQNFYNDLKVYVPKGMPFAGGGAGFIGYDSVRYIEKIPLRTGDLPDSIFVFPRVIISFDHLRHEVTVMVFTFPQENPNQAFDDGIAELNAIKEILRESAAHKEKPLEAKGNYSLPAKDDNFIDAVKKAQEHIAAGDIFQIVLSKEFRFPFNNDSFAAYRRLRAANPSPYLFYFSFKDFYVFGSSPEMLVKKEGDKVTTYPIAGTRKRTGENLQDNKAELELLADSKEKAEHVMLVDLGRNDLGKVSVPGSVRVKAFMEVQKFSHVMHLVSVVEGLCKRDVTSLDVLKAVFPAGTVSGAPKVRAMELISEFEGDSRGIYAGAVGYIDFSGNSDFCIAIRTVVVKDQEVRIRAGAGIVADSVPEKEYAEVLAKARVLSETVRG